MSSYAILENHIHHDSSLLEGARLIYADLVNLSHQKGFAWVSNQYLSNLYQKGVRSIQRWLKSLQDSGYINISYDQNSQRTIRIVDKGGG